MRLRAPGRRLWSSVVDEWDLEKFEISLLVQAVTCVDQLDQLDALVRKDGPVVESPQGPKAHPALVESRQQKLVLARLLAALRLPVGEEGAQQSSARPQRG